MKLLYYGKSWKKYIKPIFPQKPFQLDSTWLGKFQLKLITDVHFKNLVSLEKIVLLFEIKKKLSQRDAGFIAASMVSGTQGQTRTKICLVSSSFANFFVCEVIHIRLNLFIKEHLFSYE
jgi:hypothetical protein